MNANKQVFETKETWIRRPNQVINGGEWQDAVRVLVEKDKTGNVLNLSIEYSFGRQSFDEWTEEWHNRIYQFLVDRNWRVGAVSGTCKYGLAPKEVLTEGIAFKLAFFAACREPSVIDAFLVKIDAEYRKNKDQFEKDYAGVVDLETLRDVLMKGGPENSGLGFKDVKDVEAGI